jgi:hypothetical protein
VSDEHAVPQSRITVPVVRDLALMHSRARGLRSDLLPDEIAERPDLVDDEVAHPVGGVFALE